MTRVIIGLIGHAGAGKTDVAARYLIEQHGFEYMHLANTIYRMTACVVEALGGNYAYYNTRAGRKQKLPGVDFTIVELMQVLGTECGRYLDPALWIRCAIPSIQRSTNNVVVDGIRFLNEAFAIKELGGKLIRVVRDGNTLEGKAAEHESTQYIDSMTVDATLYNTSSVNQAYRHMQFILQTLYPDNEWPTI